MKAVHGRMRKPGWQVDGLSRTVIRTHAGVLALVCALLGGVGLFTMTVWLLITGGPQVGLHLRLLAHYCIGYSVSWPGSVVGFFYGALCGGIVGWSIGTIYNVIVNLRQR
jgi:hypothetical protein